MPITYWNDAAVIGPVEAGFKPAAAGLEQVARGLAPHGETGQLAAHTTVTLTGITTGILHVPGVDYAGAVIGGAQPHEIDVKSAQAMPIGGGRFAAIVQHPGNAPNPYLQRAAPSFRSLYIDTVRGLFHMGF
jgi:hypothetical protein